MVGVDFKRHRHKMRSEFGHRPYDGQALKFGGRLGFLTLVEDSGSAADDAFFAIPDLSQDSTEACGGGVGVEAEGLAKVREGSDGASRQQVFQLVKGGLAFSAPMNDRVFPGQSM